MPLGPRPPNSAARPGARVRREGVIDIAFTPAQRRTADIAVVVDVLRAALRAPRRIRPRQLAEGGEPAARRRARPGNDERHARHRRSLRARFAAADRVPFDLDAVLRALQPLAGNVRIVCSGPDGAVALDDVYVAGRLAEDITYCAIESTLATVPVLRAAGAGVATVTDLHAGISVPAVDAGVTLGA